MIREIRPCPRMRFDVLDCEHCWRRCQGNVLQKVKSYRAHCHTFACSEHNPLLQRERVDRGALLKPEVRAQQEPACRRAGAVPSSRTSELCERAWRNRGLAKAERTGQGRMLAMKRLMLAVLSQASSVVADEAWQNGLTCRMRECEVL